jgi:uncharacterized membrane protein
MSHRAPPNSRWTDRVAISRSRREAMRTTLWIVPTAMVAAVTLLFVGTYALDRAADHGSFSLPGFITSGSPDAARQILIAIAAAVITVAGVLFSITILVLQLASQQFGPRMLRNFIRDLGTQFSLGAFVATFVYSVLALGAVESAPARDFVPHISVTVSLTLTLVDLGIVIYFIHHVASSIQLTSVVSGIARDFRSTLSNIRDDAAKAQSSVAGGPDPSELSERVLAVGAPVFASASGFIQAVGHRQLMTIAVSSDTVIRLVRRPGHFVLEGQPVAFVVPAYAAPDVSEALARAHIVGPNRTLTQDLGFAVDQLVEVGIRALSPAVNDTFTALNCIDWLGDCLCHAAASQLPDGIHRDTAGNIRIIEPVITLDRLVKGATDKIRQAGSGMPAVLIRQLENLGKLLRVVRIPEMRAVVESHALRILRAGDETVRDAADRADIHAAYDAAMSAVDLGSAARDSWRAESLAPDATSSGAHRLRRERPSQPGRAARPAAAPRGETIDDA